MQAFLARKRTAGLTTMIYIHAFVYISKRLGMLVNRKQRALPHSRPTTQTHGHDRQDASPLPILRHALLRHRLVPVAPNRVAAFVVQRSVISHRKRQGEEHDPANTARPSSVQGGAGAASSDAEPGAGRPAKSQVTHRRMGVLPQVVLAATAASMGGEGLGVLRPQATNWKRVVGHV